jgi:A/G-specific adenine glycosylase
MPQIPKTPVNVTPAAIQSFQKSVYTYYKQYGRDLPWRRTWHPYHILVSEIMLQQTQVERVIDKFNEFISSFPDFRSLSHAPLRAVLTVWQGLGYNRRASALKHIAAEVCTNYNGRLPCNKDILLRFPSIGRATAASIMVFACNTPDVVIETNVRAVFIHTFFRTRDGVADRELDWLVQATMDTEHPRVWYSALMDYGSFLKKQYPRLTGKSAQYKKQSPFRGSDREIRGKVIGIITGRGSMTEALLGRETGASSARIRKIVKKLIEEGLLIRKGNRLEIT